MKKIMGLNGNSNSDMEELAKKTTNGDLAELANFINDFFLSVSDHLPRLDKDDNVFTVHEELPDEFIISVGDTVSALRKVKTNKSTGPDNIPAWVLKEHADCLAAPLASIFNCSLREGVLPNVWKSANIIPLPKTKPLMSVKSDIRPIYITPIAAKVFESIIMKDVDDIVCDTIDIKQFGGIAGTSTTDALVEMTHRWYDNTVTTPEKRHVSEKKQGTKDDTQAKRRESASTATKLDFQNGDVRAAVFGLLKNDEDIMATIIDAVSQAIVKKLLSTPSFLTSLAHNVTESGVLSGVKDEIYQSCVMETALTTDELRRLEQPEGQTDTTDAVLSLCNSQLGLELNRGHIDRSHRLGYRSETTTAADSQPKPRPVIVKLTSYETRKAIYTNKRKLKGTRFVVTENLTKRRAERLRKARTIDGITSTWTIDGRIVCLLSNGRKETVQTDSDLASVRQLCRR